jgi:hypothetical protein
VRQEPRRNFPRHFLRVALVLGAGAVALAACGPTSSPSAFQLATAESNAVSACGRMLTLGNDVVTNQTLTSAAAKKTLTQAQNYADSAAKVNPGEWKPLDQNIAQIRSSLETNHRSGLTAQLKQLGDFCAPLATNGN